MVSESCGLKKGMFCMKNRDYDFNDILKVHQNSYFFEKIYVYYYYHYYYYYY